MKSELKPGDSVFPVKDFDLTVIGVLDGIALRLTHAPLDGQEGEQHSAPYLLDRSHVSDLAQQLLAALAVLDGERPETPAGSSPH